MKYKIAICDDAKEDVQVLSDAVRRWAADAGCDVEIASFSSAESFLFRYAEHKEFDILLLDIEMHEMNGVELAKQIRAENDAVQIVFITGYPDFIAEGYEVAALHYLMKPVSPDKLGEVLTRAVSRLAKAETAVILPVDGEAVRVAVEEIVTVEAFAHTCVVTTHSARFEVKKSISALESLLCQSAADAFIRCHRSYLVGVRHIERVTKTAVVLDGGRSVPLSRGCYHAVNQAFIRYFKGELPCD